MRNFWVPGLGTWVDFTVLQRTLDQIGIWEPSVMEPLPWWSGLCLVNERFETPVSGPLFLHLMAVWP